MPELDKKYIIDTASLVSYIDYYYFDKNNGGKVYLPLKNFLIEKIKSEDIIILDKVLIELGSLRSTDSDLREVLKRYKKDSLFLFDEVTRLIAKYRVSSNVANFKSQVEISAEISRYENKYADLYLVAYCNSIKNVSVPVLMTEESMRPDRKLIHKIPTICKSENENIAHLTMPQFLFEIQKDKLIFDLNISS